MKIAYVDLGKGETALVDAIFCRLEKQAALASVREWLKLHLRISMSSALGAVRMIATLESTITLRNLTLKLTTTEGVNVAAGNPPGELVQACVTRAAITLEERLLEFLDGDGTSSGT